MAVNLPADWGVIDIRQPIVGDSFGWYALEPTAAKKSIVFHHSGSDQPAEDGFTIADYHVNGKNQWGGIGYHFVITREDYPGKPQFGLPAGAHIEYVGDLGTWRAHVDNQNPGRVGVCIVGMEPTPGQLHLARRLMELFTAPNNILPSINFMNQATVHRLVPGQSTNCPGETYPTWLPYLQGGADPYAPVVPVAPVVEPGKGAGSTEDTYGYVAEPSKQTIKRSGAYALNLDTGTTVTKDIPVGTLVDVAGTFFKDGAKFYRTVYSANNNLWNGIPVEFCEEPTGQPSAPIPVTVVPATPTFLDDVDTDKLRDAFLGLPEEIKTTFWRKLWEPFAWLLAQLPFIKKGQ